MCRVWRGYVVWVGGVVRCICLTRCRGSLCVCRAILVVGARLVRRNSARRKKTRKVTLSIKFRRFMCSVICLLVVAGCFFRVRMGFGRRIVMVLGMWLR